MNEEEWNKRTGGFKITAKEQVVWLIIFLLLLILFNQMAQADIRVQIIRVRGEKMQTDYQFDYAVNESLNIWNQVSPVPIVVHRIRTIPDRFQDLSAYETFKAWYKFAIRRGWYVKNDMVYFHLPPKFNPEGKPYFQGYAYICSVGKNNLRKTFFTRNRPNIAGHATGFAADKRYTGDDGKFMGVTAMAHEGLHCLGAEHIWLADGSCNNLMHTGSLACSIYSVPPLSEITYDNVRTCLKKRKLY